jgi:hypothetical protein
MSLYLTQDQSPPMQAIPGFEHSKLSWPEEHIWHPSL